MKKFCFNIMKLKIYLIVLLLSLSCGIEKIDKIEYGFSISGGYYENDYNFDNSLSPFLFNTTNSQSISPEIEDILNLNIDRYLKSFESTIIPAVWGQAAIFEMLVHLLQFYQEEEILHKLIFQLDFIAKKRSVDLGVVDLLRDRTVPTWITERYGCEGWPFAHAVHTGIISYAYASVSHYIIENFNEKNNSNYYNKARNYINIAERALSTHSGEFLKLDSQKGTYLFPTTLVRLGSCNTKQASLSGRHLPLNMSTAMARVHILMSLIYAKNGPFQDLNKAQWHKERASLIANYFIDFLEESSNGGYEWLYMEGGRSDDVSHAGISIRFAIEAYKANIGFTLEHINKFVDSFMGVTREPLNVYSHLNPFINTQLRGDPRYQSGVLSWLPLAEFDSRVYNISRYIHNAGFQTWLLRGFILTLGPKSSNDFIYPDRATIYLNEAYQPAAAMWIDRSTVLYYSSSPSFNVDTIDGVTVTSCVNYRFEKNLSLPLQVRYLHSSQIVDSKGCSGSFCGTNPGFRLFSSLNGKTWTRIRVPAPMHEVFTTALINPTSEYRFIMACRGGGGAARDNIYLKFIRARRPK